MSTITSRTQFKDYCLRRLGFPVIDINVDDDQVEDRIDDALLYWQDYHFDGLQKTYYIHRLTRTVMTTTADNSLWAAPNVRIVGVDSGAAATIYTVDNNTSLTLNSGQTPFIVGEGISYYDNSGTLQSAGCAVATFTMGDCDQRFLNLSGVKDSQGNPMEITGVTRIFPIQDSLSTINMFDLRYQLRLNELYDFTSASYVNYTLTQQHLRSLEIMFTGEVPVRFQRHMQRLYVDWNWGASEAPPGQVVIIEAYAIINPDVYGRVYNDRWLKEYATELIRKQWGSNLKKFGGMQLPGGVTLNGDQIYKDAETEIRRLEDDMEKNYGGILEWYMN